MPLNPPEHQFGELTPYGDPSWYRTYNRRVTLRSCCAAEDELTPAQPLLQRLPPRLPRARARLRGRGGDAVL